MSACSTVRQLLVADLLPDPFLQAGQALRTIGPPVVDRRCWIRSSLRLRFPGPGRRPDVRCRPSQAPPRRPAASEPGHGFPAQWECAGIPGQRAAAVGTMAGSAPRLGRRRAHPSRKADAMAGGSTQWRGRSVISKVVSLLDAFTADQPGALPRRPVPDHRAAGLDHLPAGVRAGRLGRARAGRERHRLPDRHAAVGAGRAGPARGDAARAGPAVHAGPATRRPGRTCTSPCSTGTRRSTWTRCPAATRCRSGPGAAAGCRCTPPGWARCCWHTPRSRCSSRCARPACAGTPRTP